MSKSFRDLVESLNAKNRKKAPTHGKVGGEPRSKGEADFAKDQGYPVKVGGDTDKPYPVKGTDDVVNRRNAKETQNVSNTVAGEKEKKTQGNSTMKDLSGFKGQQTPLRMGDKREGDTKPVRTSPSAAAVFGSKTASRAGGSATGEKTLVKTSKSAVKPVSEDVATQLGNIAKGAQGGTIKFVDGDTSNVSLATAKKMLGIASSLSPDNAKKFRETINKSAVGFLKMMKFSDKHGDK